MEEQILEGYRLAPQQDRLRLLHSASSSYRTQLTVEIGGVLHTDALAAALQHLVERHEILRTSFRSPAGVDLVLQVIADAASVALREVDITSLAGADQERHLADAFEQELGRPFDLEHEAAVHAHLFVLSADRHVLLIAFPAMSVDGESLTNVLSELTAAYAFECDKGPALSDEVLQYADFAEWQNDLLESPDAREGSTYWAREQERGDAVLRLPFEDSPGGHEVRHSVALRDAAVLSSAERLARLSGAPAPVALLACLETLLWRMTGQPDEVGVNVRFDGRRHDYMRDAVGCFGQHLPVICGFGDDDTIGDILARTRAAMSTAQRWQEFFPATARAGAGDVAKVHGFGFSYDEWPAIQRAGDTSFAVTRRYDCSAPTKLEMVCVRRPEELDVELRYDPSVYARARVEELGESLRTLLESAAASPDSAAGALPILTDDAREAALTRWNPPAGPRQEDRSIHELVEQQAQRTPDAIAVTFEETQLSYRQLDEQSNQLARYLQGLGAGADVVVGLLVERSARMIVGLLGILKAGAAYLPLEPALPQARIGAFLHEARVGIVVTESHLLDLLPALQTSAACLDRDWPAIAAESTERIDGGAGAENLAYVVFTSGSTGTPKGVAVEHRQLVNYVAAAVDRLDLTVAKSFATVSTIAADLTNTVIYPSLCSGAELHVISQERASDTAALADYFARRPVDCLKIVPSHLAALVAASDAPEQILPRKRLVLGGEALTWGTMRVFRSHASQDCRLFNHYGPTETTVGVAACDVTDEPGKELASSAPLGHPLANTQIYLLDSHLEPVPIGVAGQMYVGGANVARGYINRPDLTSESFIANPFSGDPSARLYKTGDVARYLPDGAIEFLGRADRQVKFRGFRVELGEIEAVLRDHPSVSETVAVIRGESGSQQILAYVVDGQGPPCTTEELSDYLKTMLPEFMVPARVVALDKLPLTPNGKIDHRSLPAPEHVLVEQGRAHTTPRTPTEEILQGVFTLMLGVDQVGVHDDFFEIGGHSLLATRLLSRSRDVFDVDVSLRSVFEAPTPAGIGATIDRALCSADVDPPPITAVLHEDPLPLSPAQERTWNELRLAPDGGNESNAVALRLTGELDVEVLERALAEVVARHEILRTTFAEPDGRPIQVVADAVVPSVPVDEGDASEGPYSEQRVLEWAAAAMRARFDTGASPLIRARILRLSAHEHVLVLALHKLVSDAASRRIVVRELADLYGAFRGGQASPLHPPAIQYADFAAWRRQYAASEGTDAGLPDAPARELRRSRRFAVSEETVSQLREMANEHAVTMHMVLLAAWQTLIEHHTDRADVAVASPYAGRTTDELQDLVGPCCTVLTTRLDVSGDPTFAELLGRARAAVLKAHANQHHAPAAAVQAPQPAFDVLLTLDDAAQDELRFGDLTATPLRTPAWQNGAISASHGLSVSVEDTGRGLDGAVQYDPTLLDDATVERIVAEWERWSTRLATEVERSLSSISLVWEERPA
jgi:amino acid adenylation domain-containing protein